MNRLFVAYKPAYMTSTKFLFGMKKKYKDKSCGFSGTLDPFAKGSLIIAFGQYTKLFRFFKKTQKTYRATIWLGALSDSLDIENIHTIEQTAFLDEQMINQKLQSLVGKISYIPPKFSAKWIDGKRAYNLARAGKEFEIPSSVMEVFDTKFISYRHPFISFEASVSEGGYIRSLAQVFLERIDSFGTLSYLERLKEGEFIYENERHLNPLDFLDLRENVYLHNLDDFICGKKMQVEDFLHHDEGVYFVRVKESHFSIMQISSCKVKYLINMVSLDGN